MCAFYFGLIRNELLMLPLQKEREVEKNFVLKFVVFLPFPFLVVVGLGELNVCAD